jgi:superfamily II DNA/RNA helicase
MNQNNILEKLGIEALNPMQKETHALLRSHNEVVLLSPTGTGKTVANLF